MTQLLLLSINKPKLDYVQLFTKEIKVKAKYFRRF